MAPEDTSRKEKCAEKGPIAPTGTIKPLWEGGEKDDGPQNDETMKLLSLKESSEALELTEDMILETLGPIENTSCGFGPNCQRFASAESYLVLFGLAAVAQGMYFSYSTAIITTMEKRFSLPSKISGIISMGNDIVQVLLAIHAAFIAGQGHRPRWIASGLLLSFLGCMITVIPHVIYGAGDFDVFTRQEGTHATRVEDKTIGLCSGNSTGDCEVSAEEGTSNSFTTEQLFVICLQFSSQILSGFANLMFFTVGYTYLDESVPKEKVPLYFAIAGCLRIFGPICGFATGGFVLRVWIDPFKTPVIGPSHPHWVGAWWMGKCS
ncbi:solute carrier organic anion transporter family member 74D-like [Oratosquilla oratoria]|uniref:solute carrier organic anion transporter family member 74D-like n=1 Tax=Oratosquilla oratoria TaxID=337810 RepID=UPI003F75A7A8